MAGPLAIPAIATGAGLIGSLFGRNTAEAPARNAVLGASTGPPITRGTSDQPGTMFYSDGQIHSYSPSSGWTSSNVVQNPTSTNSTRSTGQTAAQQQAARRAAEEAAANARFIENLKSSQGMYQNQANTALNQFRSGYNADNRDFVNQIRDQQDETNRGLARNTLNLDQTMGDIIRSAQQGLRSGGVALAGMNASDSGAVDALGRAYSQVANKQTGEARGQFSDVLDDLQRSQGILNRERDTGFKDLRSSRENKIATERQALSDQLEKLNQQARGQNVDWRSNQGLVNQVVNQALGRLQNIEQRTQQRLGGISQWGGDRVAQEAQNLRNQGIAGSSFNFSRPGTAFGGAAPTPGAQPFPVQIRNREELPLIRRPDERR